MLILSLTRSLRRLRHSCLPPCRPAGEGYPPLVNFGAAGVVRCRTCRAYINPYVTFPPEKGGTVWICNLCYRLNEVVAPYFSSLDNYGRRNDLADRPELIHSTIEIVAPVEVPRAVPRAVRCGAGLLLGV